MCPDRCLRLPKAVYNTSEGDYARLVFISEAVETGTWSGGKQLLGIDAALVGSQQYSSERET